MSTAPATPVQDLDWRRIHAFGLPNGSIRALLGFLIFGAIWAWLLLQPEKGVPSHLQNLMFIIMGHYFAIRHRQDQADEAGPPPLFLPRRAVRLLLVGGFVGVTAFLFYQERVWVADQPSLLALHEGMMTLILVAGFLLGVALNRFLTWWRSHGHKPSRVFEDGRAILSLVAAGLLVFLVFGSGYLSGHELLEQLHEFVRKYKAEEMLAAVVGFYFGSRS